MEGLRLQRAAGLAGVLASLSYAAGDVLLLGSPAEPDRHPALRDVPGAGRTALAMVPVSTGRLTTGALAGVYATPLYLAAIWHLHEGLAPAGPRRALPPTLIMAGSWTMASFIHGSFFHTGEAWTLLEDLAPEARDRVVAQTQAFSRVTLLASVPFGLATVVASGLIARVVLSGQSAYPRWSAPLVSPVVPVALAVATTASHVLPGRARHGLQGAGISLGHLVTFAASTALLWSGRRLRRAWRRDGH